MRVVVLASGSKGNITYLEYKETKILIDFGMNITYVLEQMKKNQIDYKKIDAILLTHTHKDHTQGLKAFLKRKKVPVYILEDMSEELEIIDFKIYEQENRIKDINFEILKTSHDKPSVGFLFKMPQEIVYITDTGYIKRDILKKIENKYMYILESNYDIEMLMHGSYPHFLKQRILSDKGHLSNDAALSYFKKIKGDKTKLVILAHLSENNNTREKVKEVFENDTTNLKMHIANQRESLALELSE